MAQKIKTLTEDEFYEKFTPIKNHIGNNGSFDDCMFEISNDEYKYVCSVYHNKNTQNRVWTIIEDHENDALKIISGLHRINRWGFLITKESFNENLEITLD